MGMNYPAGDCQTKSGAGRPRRPTRVPVPVKEMRQVRLGDADACVLTEMTA
jgi:hypothetical protein